MESIQSNGSFTRKSMFIRFLVMTLPPVAVLKRMYLWNWSSWFRAHSEAH